MTPIDRARHEARKLTTDQVVELQRAYREAQLYIATLADANNAKDQQIDLLESALARACDAVPIAVSDEPTISRTQTRPRAA